MLVLPVATATALGWLVIPLCFIVNLTYFLIDECSGQMEEPFGTDPNDVALEKTLRRIDKLTASQLCQYLKRPVTNFNLFPESRSTDHSGKVTNRVRQMGHLSETAGVEWAVMEPTLGAKLLLLAWAAACARRSASA